ncbi:rRNA maturation RNase YbeY [Nitrosospira lacus]|uniref:Endoribonuclease YbeY n=1 Tax=Nitrosospira lacus TaxID=1288494 RepID=A0A1W6SLX0_9PROT|nr:rRNA maturation RNase YbeY [Nitrosospira lacus]ARO86809.1 rRNA maturation RNase YbeY [Nitrosospira lacus]
MKNRSSVSKLSEGVTHKEAKLKLTTQYATRDKNVPARSQFRRWVKAALMQDAEIVLRIVDEAEGHNLNRDFRGRDCATNVLTFVYSDVPPLSGDVVLCAPIMEKEAAQQDKTLAAHYAHLTVHGVLHLQGYDHDSDAGAMIMEKLETDIVMKLGHDDPYKDTGGNAEEP